MKPGDAAKVANRTSIAKAAARMPTVGPPRFKLFMILRFLAGRNTSVLLYNLARIQVDLWQMMLQRMYYFRFWEPNISRLVETVLRPGDVFVDLGGGIRLLAARPVGDAGAVISVDALSAPRRRRPGSRRCAE
jgi:hypothetical protein